MTTTSASGAASSTEKKLIGPLSSFAPPSSCFSEFDLAISLDAATSVTALVSWGHTIDAGPCYPSASSLAQPGGGYFSPGICPLGWTALPEVPTRTTVTATRVSFLTARPLPTQGLAGRRAEVETTLFCCPSGYAFVWPDIGSGRCISTLFDGKGPPHDVTLHPLTGPTDIVRNPTYILPSQISPAVSYNFALNGILTFTQAVVSHVYATVLEVRHQGSPDGIPIIPNPNGGSDAASGIGGLSTGAKAGIAIGAVLGVLLLATAAFVLWRRRRNRHREISHPGLPEVHDTQRFEKDGKNVAFVPPTVHELDSSHDAPPSAHELPSVTTATTTTTAHGSDPQEPTSAPHMAAPWKSEPDSQFLPPPSLEPPATDLPARSPSPPNRESAGATPDPPGNGKLEQLQRELERVRAERERLHQIQQLESRETELERLIQQEMARGPQLESRDRRVSAFNDGHFE
ncbi:hypothetical protein B0T16DRAFT_219295 [Cercophora newfieldiana]|uniref:Uncharacterized protein n=1 Tax=Cercophora newfieldiana TaxID=92897 RepID=A0AA40CKD4_9PEZI|nr:hypothetical protein B0T16DRAFT_219295 [Cercophora newfieldiana]